MTYSYYYEWKKLIPKPNEIDCVTFKLDFTGGYAMKVIKDGYFVPIIDDDLAICIPKHHKRDAIDFLKKENYKCDEHSIIKW